MKIPIKNLLGALLLILLGVVIGYIFAVYQAGEMANLYTDKLPGCW